MKEMINQNSELIHSFYEILNSKDITGLHEKIMADTEFVFPLSLPYGGVSKGYEKIMDSFTVAFTYLGFTHFDVTNYMYDDDSIICLGIFYIGAFGFLFTDIFTARDNKILKRVHFIDTALILDNFKTNFI